jgi:hypothetical protein
MGFRQMLWRSGLDFNGWWKEPKAGFWDVSHQTHNKRNSPDLLNDCSREDLLLLPWVSLLINTTQVLYKYRFNKIKIMVTLHDKHKIIFFEEQIYLFRHYTYTQKKDSDTVGHASPIAGRKAEFKSSLWFTDSLVEFKQHYLLFKLHRLYSIEWDGKIIMNDE